MILAPFRTLLLPLTPLYRLGLARRERRLASGKEPIRRLPFPVVSIGNLSTGGSGKTPLAIALGRALAERGFGVNVLSRGYGRRNYEPAHVDPAGTAEQFGDEPLLIARETGLPVYVASQRYDAGLLALRSSTKPINSGLMIGLLDDGFQHRQLHRDIDILLLDRRDFHDRLLPAGDLREDLHSALRADVIAIPADDLQLEAELRDWLAARKWNGTIWRLRRRMEVPETEGPVVAFCGIARPGQFFNGLEAAGLRITARVPLKDHHWYTEGDLRRLDKEARNTGASALVTTQKDSVRLPEFRWSAPLFTARLRTEIEDSAAAIEWLAQRFRAASAAR
jgi:tetraacyldisaccharide 4'-kinase